MHSFRRFSPLRLFFLWGGVWGYLFYFSQALAQVEPSAIDELDSLILQGGFYSLAEVPYKTELLPKAAKAVVKVGDCSGVILSPSGLVATNLHCIDECLQPTWNYNPDFLQTRIEKPNFYKISLLHERIPTRLKCPAHISRQFTVFEYQLSQPEMLWMGRGRQTHREERINELTPFEVQLLKDYTQDIVLLRYQRHPDFQVVPCAPISKMKVRPHQPIWALGYPDYNKRPNGKNADRSRLSVSLGRVRSSVKEDPVYQNYASKMNPKSAAEFWRREAFIWEQPVHLLASADIYFGNSGGLIMNEGGAVAITFTVSKASAEIYTGGSGIGYRLSELIDLWKTDLAPEIVSEIEACK